MNKRIIYPNDDGGVSIVIPAPAARNRWIAEPQKTEIYVDERKTVRERVISEDVWAEESDEEFLARIAAKDVPAGKPFKIVDVSEIPEDRTFRGAWEYQP